MEKERISKPALAIMIATASLFVGGMILLIVMSAPDEEAGDSRQAAPESGGDIDLESVGGGGDIQSGPSLKMDDAAGKEPIQGAERPQSNTGLDSLQSGNVRSGNVDLGPLKTDPSEVPEAANVIGTPDSKRVPVLRTGEPSGDFFAQEEVKEHQNGADTRVLSSGDVHLLDVDEAATETGLPDNIESTAGAAAGAEPSGTLGKSMGTEGRSPAQELYTAAAAGNIPQAEALLKSHPDILNATIGNAYGSTPLHFATHNGRTEMVRMLLAAGANVNAVNRYGTLPLHDAAGPGHLEIVALLLENDSAVNVQDGRGITALEYALQGKHYNVAELLRRHGASENATTSGNEANKTISISIIKDGFAPAPSRFGTYSGYQTKLSEKRPDKIAKEPVYAGRKQWYGRLDLGTQENKGHYFCLDLQENGQFLLYFDRNKNADLSDDGSALRNEGSGGGGPGGFACLISVPWSRLVDAVSFEGDFDSWLFCNEGSWGSSAISHYSNTSLMGRVAIGDEVYEGLLIDTKYNDGDLTNDGISIDLNRNGRVDKDERPRSKYVLDGTTYEFEVTW